MVADPLATVPNAVVITTLSPLTESNNLTSLGLLFRSRNAVAIDCVMNTLPQFTNLRKLAISSIMISDAIAPVGEAKRMTAATINGALELVPLTVVEMWIFNYEKKKWYVQEKRTADKFVPALAKDNVERRGGNIKFLCWRETEKFEVGYVRNKVEQSGYGDSFKIVGWGYVYDGCPKPWTPRGYVYSAYYGYPREPGRAWRYGLQESDSEADCR